MNELSEFFSSVAKEKKRVEEERIRFTPRVNIDLSDLSNFFGTITEAKREHVVLAKRESTKLDALKGFFNRLDQFESALNENIEKQKQPVDGFDEAEVKYDVETPKKEPVVVEKETEELKENSVTKIADVMSGLGFKKEEVTPLTDLQKLQMEFRHFKDLVIKQMASIGGGGEVRLLNLDDVDTSSLGNGKFMIYNSSTKKIEFTDQVDGN